MPQFRPRPQNMATSRQLGRPAHVPEAIQQTSSQAQMVSNIATAHATIIALGGEYVTVPDRCQPRSQISKRG